MIEKNTQSGYRSNQLIFQFILIAYTIPLICAGAMVGLPILQRGIWNQMIFGIQSMAPSLAAIFMVFYISSKKGLGDFLKEKYLSNVNLKLCLWAFLAPMMILAVAKSIEFFLVDVNFGLIFPNLDKTIIIFWALIAEELGWRGFLQERVEAKMGTLLTPLFVGTIWGIWHFHYFITGVMSVPFALLVLGCIFESYGYFMITKFAKGNILPASIWHFSGNLFINLFTLNKSYLSYLIMTLSYGLCLVAFLIYYKKKC